METSRIVIRAEWSLEPHEFLADLTLTERIDLLKEMAGGSHIPIDTMRRIINDAGYDDPPVKEEVAPRFAPQPGDSPFVLPSEQDKTAPGGTGLQQPKQDQERQDKYGQHQ